MDLSNPVVQLCMAGTRAEFEKRPADAQRCYQEAWDLRQTAVDACIAAHYVARFQPSVQEELRWNQIALEAAQAAGKEQTLEFLPSLYLSLGNSYEKSGNDPEAQKYYALSAALGVPHQP